MTTSNKPSKPMKYPANIRQFIWWKITGKSPYGPYRLSGVHFKDF